MNIQIFGKAKCFGTRSAERFFKERKINFQYIDLTLKGMSMRELESVANYLGDVNAIVDTKSTLYKSTQFENLRSKEGKLKCLALNPKLLLTPIVRDCDSKKATAGDCVEVWKNWLADK